MTMRKFLLVFVLAVHAGSSAQAQVAEGRALYMKVGCYQCHGTEGQGGNAGPRIAPGPMAWEAFAQFVHNTSDAMPPYSDAVLPDMELKVIHAFLQSIAQPTPVSQIPLLNGQRK